MHTGVKIYKFTDRTEAAEKIPLADFGSFCDFCMKV